MSILSFGQSITTTCVVILALIVTVNTYDLMLSWFNYDNYLNRIPLSNEFITKKYLVQVQTILSLFAIVVHKEYTSSRINLIKFWIFAPLLATLFFEMMLTVASVLFSWYKRISDESDDIIRLNFYKVKPTTTTSASDTSYFFVGALLLFLYFVFKLYAAVVILDYTSVFVKRIGVMENAQIDGIYLINDRDVERNEFQPTTSTPPPKYERCALEFPPPPPYSVIHMC